MKNRILPIIVVFYIFSCQNQKECSCRFGDSYRLMKFNVQKSISLIKVNKIDSAEALGLKFTLLQLDSISDYLVVRSGGLKYDNDRIFICNEKMLSLEDLNFVNARIEVIKMKVRNLDKKNKYIMRINQYLIYEEHIKRPEFDQKYLNSSLKVSLALDFLSLGNDLALIYMSDKLSLSL